MRLVIDKQPESTRSPNLADAAVMCCWPVDGLVARRRYCDEPDRAHTASGSAAEAHVGNLGIRSASGASSRPPGPVQVAVASQRPPAVAAAPARAAFATSAENLPTPRGGL